MSVQLGLKVWRQALSVAGAVFPGTAQGEDLHFMMIPHLAVMHLASSMETANYANQNENNFYSVAICLLRQCVEALSVIDLGLQPPAYSRPIFEKWEKGKLTAGALRKRLETDIWPRYGNGLWSEPWADFWRNLARAVQPYAHYTPELMGWQVKDLPHQSGPKWLAVLSPRAYDAVRTRRILILQAIVTWAFARLLIANRRDDAHSLVADTDQLQAAIRDAKLLWAKNDWATQLMPHVLYGPEFDWGDEGDPWG